MVPALPGLSGSPGWVRSSAWIWDFSSTESTTACLGGSTYRPTMSSSLAANSGSVEGRRRRHDFRPAQAEAPTKQAKAAWLQAMADKLASAHGQARYKRRQQTVEPVFGIIEAILGFTRFSLRGLDKVTGEWDLVARASTCKRLHKLQLAMAS